MAMDFFITIGMLVVAGTNRRSVGSLELTNSTNNPPQKNHTKH